MENKLANSDESGAIPYAKKLVIALVIGLAAIAILAFFVTR